MSNQASLSAASNDRKARLAQLKSLKRKQANVSQDDERDRIPTEAEVEAGDVDDTDRPSQQSLKRKSRSPSPSDTTTYLSGRNFDRETRGPKLGFEAAPSAGQSTIESQAKEIAQETKRQQEEEEKEDKPLDLFKLQPKNPNWDLKRDLEKKLEILNVRTDNAIARLVRERIQKAQKEAKARGVEAGDGEAVGMEGKSLVEAMHLREREEEEDKRRQQAEDLNAGLT